MKNTLKTTLFALAGLAVLTATAQQRPPRAARRSADAPEAKTTTATPTKKDASTLGNKAPEATTTTTKKVVQKRNRVSVGTDGTKSLR